MATALPFPRLAGHDHYNHFACSNGLISDGIAATMA
jgi:hypothetical protein